MAKNREPIDFSKLKPPSAYLDSLSDFARLLGDLEEADKAAREMLEETGDTPPPAPAAQAPAPRAEAQKEEAPQPTLEELMSQLNSLVGLDKIKENVTSLMNLVKIRKLREEKGLPNADMSLHLVFMGNPGTGKTTVARLIAGLYRAIGVLSGGQLVEVDRGGLVAGYVGQTAQKTREVIEKAKGGVLFIDEAYALAPGDNPNDFGREAIETLLKAMEDHRKDLVVIVAGYAAPMETFISSNPGLESRFNRYLVFEDYSAGELWQIFRGMCRKGGYTLTSGAEDFAKSHLAAFYENRDENFGNARDVRNFFENAVAAQSDRLAKSTEELTREDLEKLTKADLVKASEI